MNGSGRELVREPDGAWPSADRVRFGWRCGISSVFWEDRCSHERTVSRVLSCWRPGGRLGAEEEEEGLRCEREQGDARGVKTRGGGEGARGGGDSGREYNMVDWPRRMDGGDLYNTACLFKQVTARSRSRSPHSILDLPPDRKRRVTLLPFRIQVTCKSLTSTFVLRLPCQRLLPFFAQLGPLYLPLFRPFNPIRKPRVRDAP